MATPAITTIGVIGAGQMGSGIAQVCARAGYAVALYDIAPGQLEAARQAIAARLGRGVERGDLGEAEKTEALARIEVASSVEALGDCGLVIEAASEDEAVKRAIFAALGPALGPEAMIATNTSSISITRLAAASDRPERFIGMHFMNPVPVMELVELIRGMATDAETFEAVRALALELGKTVVVAEDFPAFLVNRVLAPMINEAIFALSEGVGSVEDIDTAVRLGLRHPMGPLELADFVGLDTCLAIMRVMHEGFADSKYRPCPLLVKYVEAGWLGRKSGRGFYDYSGAKPVPSR
jgi:3-hydroxybutyryl-CoA dehydrogenase